MLGLSAVSRARNYVIIRTSDIILVNAVLETLVIGSTCFEANYEVQIKQRT
jgi:hypothetical protein